MKKYIELRLINDAGVLTYCLLRDNPKLGNAIINIIKDHTEQLPIKENEYINIVDSLMEKGVAKYEITLHKQLTFILTEPITAYNFIN